MKKFVFMFLLFSLVYSCKKSSADSVVNMDPMTVKEDKTNTPIPGVRVDFYTCIDNLGQCTDERLFSTGYTDSLGRYTFSQDEIRMANRGIILTKEGYFKASGGSGERFMTAAATLRLRFIKAGSYPANSIIEFHESPARNSDSYRYILSPLPADTMTTLQLAGNENYTISWSVADPANCQIRICTAPYFNSGSLTGIYLPKFADTVYTIQY